MLNQPLISFAANRLVWGMEAKQPVVESQEAKAEAKNTFDPKAYGKKRAEAMQAQGENPQTKNEEQNNLQKAEKALDKAYSSKEIPAELQKLNHQQIRNLERKNPEMLFKTCFQKIGEGEKLTPIENSSELKAGDKVRFSVEDAAGKNNNLEMGAGLRTLPDKFKVVQIGNEKFYRVYDGGPFVDAQGEYRAVRTHTKETIVLTDGAVPAEIKQQIESRKGDYVRSDVNSAFDTWLADRKLTPELIDQFTKEMEGSEEFTPEMQKVLKEREESLKKFAKLWEGFNMESYKEQIANIESRGSGGYTADNHGIGSKDPKNKRAIGRYQFTVETLRGYDVQINNEADITAFKETKEGRARQEEIMDHFTEENIRTIGKDANKEVVAQIADNTYTIYQVLGAMHLGGAGALERFKENKKNKGDKLAGTDYAGTSFREYMDRMKKPKSDVA